MIRWPTVHLLRGRARAGRETLRGGRMQRCTTRHTGEGQAGWDLGPTAHVRKQPNQMSPPRSIACIPLKRNLEISSAKRVWSVRSAHLDLT